MKRFHALEWEDLNWFPASWRDFGTDFIRFIAEKFKLYQPIVPLVEKGIKSSKSNQWIDVASGGGGGILTIGESVKSKINDVQIILTDFFPNKKAFERVVESNQGIFNYETDSVDAKNLPQKYQRYFRTMFGSFHHFRKNDAKQILQNAVDNQAPIAIFEPVRRDFMSFFSILFIIPNVLIFTPFIRPVRWGVLPFIYLIPIIPLFVLWDGVASIFRIYSTKELNEMVKTLNNHESFEWEIGLQKSGPSKITYLLGTPKN